MRFRPSSGLNPNPNRPDREASEARAEVVGDKAPQDKVYDRARHAQEIERAENIAAGLPPEGAPKTEEETKSAAESERRFSRTQSDHSGGSSGGKAI